MIQPWFEDAKLGIFLHWGIYAVKPTGESWPFFLGEISHEDYMKQAEGFTAANYDPSEWARLFKAACADYAVLTTKHHDGMALWPTKLSSLNVVEGTPAGRDLIRPYVNALREADIRVGLYFSHLDWSHPDYPTLPPNSNHAVNQFNFVKEDPEAWERFLVFHRGQLKELCDDYQPDLLWFDGDWERDAEQWRMKELREQLTAWTPQAVLNSRMHVYGDYATPEQAIPTVRPEGQWEFCMTCNDFWGYMDSDANYKSVKQIIWFFIKCFSRGGKLLLDFGPKEDGTFPPEQLNILKGLARWNQKHYEAIFPSVPGLPEGLYDGSSTLSRDRKHLYLFCTQPISTEFPVMGICNQVEQVRVLGEDTMLNSKRMGGADWSKIPGILWISPPPPAALDPDCTVIELTFNEPLELYLGESGAIEQN